MSGERSKSRPLPRPQVPHIHLRVQPRRHQRVLVGERDRATSAVHLHVHLPGLQAAADDVDVPPRAREGDVAAGGGHTHDFVTFQSLVNEMVERRGNGERVSRGLTGWQRACVSGTYGMFKSV